MRKMHIETHRHQNSKMLAISISWVFCRSKYVLFTYYLWNVQKIFPGFSSSSSHSISIIRPSHFIYQPWYVYTVWSYAILSLFQPVSYCNIGKLDISQTHHTERSRIILHLRFISYRSSSPLLFSSKTERERERGFGNQYREWMQVRERVREQEWDDHTATLEIVMWILMSQIFGRKFH